MESNISTFATVIVQDAAVVATENSLSLVGAAALLNPAFIIVVSKYVAQASGYCVSTIILMSSAPEDQSY
jgi:hypothetical protein